MEHFVLPVGIAQDLKFHCTKHGVGKGFRGSYCRERFFNPCICIACRDRSGFKNGIAMDWKNSFFIKCGSQLSPGIILMSGVVHDTGILQS